ncbi:hypothetical protein MicloDRAFT_00070110 [Microvirga lotononidis]|uniref:Uncharacterized protein n=1 Tax=Microvirga lotononidis TaxID=864069 RepID=I4YK66_9HYPH|nr:hypothetical protein MicloDRAFT_00070110 [Microvirga lotononidis]
MVTDPGHPLWGRRFVVVSIPRSLCIGSHVRVAYGDDAVLRIPVAATNLSPPSCRQPVTKLTLEAIRDLIRLATEGETPCPSSPTASGSASVPTAAAASSMTSSSSCRR